MRDFTFLSFFCIFLPPLLNLFYYVLTVSVLYHALLCMKCSLDISNFLEVIFSLSQYIVFLYFIALFIEEGLLLSLLFSGTLHSVGYIFPFLICFFLLFFPQSFVKPPQTTISPSCVSFPWGWFWSSPPIRCYELLSIVLQTVYQT